MQPPSWPLPSRGLLGCRCKTGDVIRPTATDQSCSGVQFTFHNATELRIGLARHIDEQRILLNLDAEGHSGFVVLLDFDKGRTVLFLKVFELF